MTARDRWDQKLKCVDCGRGGTAELSQADGHAFMRNQTTHVDHLPEGFRYTGGTGLTDPVKFFCNNCGRSA